MSKPFDMALFLSGVQAGSKSTQQRHLRQARIMQTAIQQRGLRQSLDLATQTFKVLFTQNLQNDSNHSHYYYRPTALLVCKRLGTDRKKLL